MSPRKSRVHLPSRGAGFLKAPMMSAVARLQLPPRSLSQLLSISQQWWERLLPPGIWSSNRVNNVNYNSKDLRMLNMLLTVQNKPCCHSMAKMNFANTHTHTLYIHVYVFTIQASVWAFIWIPLHFVLKVAAIHWYPCCWMKPYALFSRPSPVLSPCSQKVTYWEPFLAGNLSSENSKTVSPKEWLTILV